MSTKVHPTAIVESGAELGEDVEVGPYAYIGPRVQLGDRTVVWHHATVEGLTVMGVENRIFPYAYIGAQTHDLKFMGGMPGLKIGNRNTLREYVTVHAATGNGDFTVLGDDNVVLAYSHVAHDCVVGNHVVMSSHAAFGGHVVTGDHVNVGWGVGVHQFCRLGNHAMISACSKVVQDVLPFMLVDGVPAEHRSVNKVGLERNGFSSGEIEQARSLFKILFQALEKLQGLEIQDGDRILPAVLDFAGGATDRGLA